jgi:hypothetical protein
MKALLVALVVAGAVALLWTLTVAQQGATCEVCMAFEGRRACKAASAATRDEAMQHATATACALLGGGVTEDLACQRAGAGAAAVEL